MLLFILQKKLVVFSVSLMVFVKKILVIFIAFLNYMFYFGKKIAILKIPLVLCIPMGKVASGIFATVDVSSSLTRHQRLPSITK